jgi:uncharacterized radical SAM superfamily protein
MDCWHNAWAQQLANPPSQIHFVRPRRTLPVSLTGTFCELQCAHCAGHYLQGMVSVNEADAEGMTSCLISGGFDRQGRLPVSPCLPYIAALRPGRVLNWHLGMIDEAELVELMPYVDVVSFDIIGDDDTIHEVYGLDYSAEDYLSTYQMLRRHVRVVPHLTLGLRGGAFSGEYDALWALQAAGLEALVLLVLLPTQGTRYAACGPPILADVADFILTARRALSDTPIYVGCMRPGGRYRRDLDALAVWAGVDKIVNPAPSAVRLATELGLEVKWEDECCAIQRL